MYLTGCNLVYTPLCPCFCGGATMPWEHVDAGWGRCAPEFAYLFENLHWREYIHLLDQTGVGPGTRYLDIACGSGLAVRLARGLDASPRLAAIAAARSPEADIRAGDMVGPPFPNHHFRARPRFRGSRG